MSKRKIELEDIPFTLSFLLFVIIGVGYSACIEASAKTSCEIDSYQQSVVNLSYSLGEPYDLGETMVAIALQESELGRYNISLVDPSAGYHHVLVAHALKDLGWSDTPYNRNRVVQKMLDNPVWSSGLAIRELRWWKDHHNGDWRKMLAGYNGGHAGNDSYAEKVAQHVHHVRKCDWLEGMN